jgi:hypothetical protein
MSDQNISPQGEASDQNSDPLMSAFELGSGESQPQGEGGAANVQNNSNQGSGNSGNVDTEYEQAKNDPVKLARLFQSRYDKAASKLSQIEPNFNTYQQRSQFLESLITDKDLRMSFIHQYEPDLLVKDVDVEKYVETQLAKEFPDFEYNPEEAARKPWSKHGDYQKRAMQLTDEARKDPAADIPLLKDLQTKLETEAKARAEKYEKDLTDLKGKYKVDDKFMENFTKWGQKLNTEDLLKMYIFAVNRLSRMNTNFSSNIPGGGNVNTLSPDRERARRIFGDY